MPLITVCRYKMHKAAAGNPITLTLQVVYVPDAEGEYDVFVKFADADIPKSPFKVRYFFFFFCG